MIDGKRSFKIILHNNEEIALFRDFMIRNNGDKKVLEEGYLIPNQLYEVSVELKCRYLHLHGWCSHVGYPASFIYKDDLKGFIFWYENNYLGFQNVGIIKHIPHASLDFPEGYDYYSLLRIYGNYKFDNYKQADLFVDDLFADINGVEIKAKYSRLYCDVERFKSDEEEPMAKIGQGYIYTNSLYNGNRYWRHLVYNGKDLFKGIDKYYDDHHKRLTDETKKILSLGKKVLILDLHSFSDEQAILIGKEGPFPDVCIGLNDTTYDQRILNVIIKKIEDKGYSYRINYPYSGSIVPKGLTKRQLEKISSIMIEVNKRVYL